MGRLCCSLSMLLLIGNTAGAPAALSAEPFGPCTRQASSRPAGRPLIRLAAAECDVGEAVVKFRDGVSDAAVDAAHAQIGAEVLNTIQGTRIQRIRARGQCDEDIMWFYESRPEVEWAQRAPNREP